MNGIELEVDTSAMVVIEAYEFRGKAQAVPSWITRKEFREN